MADLFFRRRWRTLSLPLVDVGSEGDGGGDDVTIGIGAAVDSGSVDDNTGSRTQRFNGC
mgnify:CR=1 FL=1